jgi:preprotein translocase subunit SecA
VQDDTVVLVDEITGRKMTGLRLGKEMHQALEAKERVTIQPNTKVARSITIQRLFEPYKKLGGMTGTAWESRREFQRVYKMSVFSIPTNRPLRRTYLPDLIYRTEEERWDAVAEDVARRHAKGQPILIGTRSVAKSELLSEKLKAKGIEHVVLNARRHAEEGAIIANAGQKGAVTISTAMAGRGVDIKLGPDVPDLGGLHIIGTERHELRRLDNQLGGRCGRQGDPGSVQFFSSLDDEVLKILSEKRLKRLQRRYDDHRGPIRDRRVPRAINKAQRLFEWYFAEVRKMLLEREKYDEKLAEYLYGQ